MSTDKRLAHFVLTDRTAPRAEGLVPESPRYLRRGASPPRHLELLETVERAPMTVGLAHSTRGPRRVEAK